MKSATRVRLSVAGAVVSTLVVSSSSLGGPGPAAGSVPWAVIVAGAFGCVAALIVWAPVGGPRQRPAWDLVVLWALLFAAAGIWFVASYSTAEPAEVPAPPDVLFLVAYACLTLAVVLMYRRPVEEAPRVAMIDGVLVGLAVMAVAAASVLDWLIPEVGGGREAVVVAYAVLDACLLGTLGVVAGREVVDSRRWRLLLLAGTLLLVADLAFLHRVGDGDLSSDVWYHPLYLLAGLALAGAAWSRPKVASHRPVETARMIVLPVTVAAVASAILVWDHFEPRSDLTIVLCTLALAGVGIRAGLTVRFLRRLVDARRLAMTDDLTGLPNRRWFIDELDDAVASGSDGFAVLVLGLDRFKVLNDTLGHDAGDQVLRDCAARLSAELQADDRLARIGGDEFAVLPAGGVGAVSRLVGAIRLAFSTPLEVSGLSVPIDVSVGGAVHPEHGDRAERLLRHADVALHEAKHSHERWAMYHPASDPFSFRRLALATELRSAIGNGELSVVYQPILDIRTDRFVAAEALVRWNHPTFGVLQPNEFLDIAQQVGMLRDVTERVLDEALGQACRWRVDDGLSLGVCVNLPPSALLDVRLPSVVQAALDRSGMAARFLTLELTENGLLEDPVTALRILHDLRARGVRLSVDDYGVDYASLSYLRDLPVDALKIDRSFMVGVGDSVVVGGNVRNPAIVKSTVVLAHELGFDVVAEGVESARTLDRLAEWGVDAVQGYLIAEPMAGAGMANAQRIWDHRYKEADAVVDRAN